MLRGSVTAGAEQDYVRSLMALPPQEREELMRSEAERLRTYGTALWPIGDVMPPEELAAAGFYYTGVQDRVQCAFCRGVLRNWERGDSAMNEHRLHFSYCRLVMGLDCGNITLAQLQSASLATTGQPRMDDSSLFAASHRHAGGISFYTGVAPTAVDGANCLSSTGHPEPLPGVSTSRPKYPEYAVEARRLQSFSPWPLWALQSPENLVKAGFFYAGFGDNVKCFYCGGGLHNWEIIDSPWEEHARWFPKCDYLLSVKGQDFVNAIMDKVASASGSHVSTQASSIAPKAGQQHSAEESNMQQAGASSSPVSQLFEQRSVQLVRQLGYTEQQICAALSACCPDYPALSSPISATALLQMTMQTAGDLVNEQANVLPVAPRSTEASLASNMQKSGGYAVPMNGAIMTAGTTTVTSGSELQNRGLHSAAPLKDASVVTGVAAAARSCSASTSTVSSFCTSKQMTSLQLSLPDLVLTGLVDIPEGASRLKEENRLIRKHLECKSCRQRQAEMVLLPCGHFATCLECVPTVRLCPMCSTVVRGTIRTYLC